MVMIAVQTIRATNRAPAESVMSAWTAFDLKAMSLPLPIDPASSYISSNKRKRDCFEAYDFQVHRQQKMRYSLLREQPQEYLHPSPVYSRNSLENLAEYAVVPKCHTVLPPPEIADPCKQPTKQSDNILKTRRRKKSKKSSSSSSSSSNRRSVRMTRKHYNKKKRLVMMEATDRQIQRILESGSTSMPFSEKLFYVRRKAEQLNMSLRGQCNSIVQKERDIKSWLGMTTSNKSKIVSLRKRLHDRWAEVKDLQTEVKPRRQRLKNLKFAALCEERSITEE